MGRKGEVAYGLAVASFVTALVSLEGMRVAPSAPVEYLYIFLVGFALIPLALLIVSTVIYIVLPPKGFPRASVVDWPTVAVLYVAYNDVLPAAIETTLQNLDYPNAEVWLLSDSTSPESRHVEEALQPRVLLYRRSARRGGKAGAINDWLRQHGDRYEYVVPMDADAILAHGTLRSLVEIAEHPQNKRFAGFQTLMEVHPRVAPTSFARVLGRAVRWSTRIVPLANQRVFGQGMYWGSNALLRADVVRRVRWAEDTICEDFALTARLDSAGHPIALVDVYNYEGFPPDALSLRERTVRWCRANLSVAPSVFRMKTGLAVRWNVSIPILFYLMAPTLLGLLVVSLLTPAEMALHRLSAPLGGSLLTFVFLHRIVAIPGGRMAVPSFLVTLAAETLVVLSMALRVTWAFVECALRPPIWSPSRKNAQRMSMLASVRASVPELAFGAFLIGLIVAYRPSSASVALASVWIASFFSAPIVLFASSRPSTASEPASTSSVASARITSSRTKARSLFRTQTPKVNPIVKPRKIPIHK